MGSLEVSVEVYQLTEMEREKSDKIFYSYVLSTALYSVLVKTK